MTTPASTPGVGENWPAWAQVRADVAPAQFLNEPIPGPGTRAGSTWARPPCRQAGGTGLLDEEHRRLRRAEYIGRVGSWEFDVATEIVTWSAGLSRLMGREPETFASELAASITSVQSDDVEAAVAALRTCVRTGEPKRMRYRINRVNDGAERWMDARAEPVYHEGRVVRIDGMVADVTEQVEAEQAATSARSFQQAIMTASPDFIYVWDLESRSTVWKNRSLVHELGYTDEQVQDMAGDANGRVVPADARAAYDAAVVAIRNAATDDVAQLDLPLLRPDGTRRWYDRRIAPLQRDKDGKVTQFVGVLRDMTAPMAVQTALRESEAKSRQLAENIDVAFTLRTWEPDAFLYVSPGYEKLWGYDPTKVSETPTEADHRRHAIIEQVIADLKNGPLAHLPSGRFTANAAWLVLAAVAFNLTRAAGALASLFHAKATTATIRRHLINVPARPVRSARRTTLRLSTKWPWATAWLNLFSAAIGPPATAA